jgi:hypothetical protein
VSPTAGGFTQWSRNEVASRATLLRVDSYGTTIKDASEVPHLRRVPDRLEEDRVRRAVLVGMLCET